MKEVGINFSEDVKINKFNLPESAEEQASVYLHYLELLADKKKKKDSLKTRLEYLTAKAGLEYRKMDKPPVKITEAALKELLAADEKLLEKREEINKINSDIYDFEAAKLALEQRNSQIKVLKDLLIGGFYGDPSRANKTKKDSDNHRSQLNRRK